MTGLNYMGLKRQNKKNEKWNQTSGLVGHGGGGRGRRRCSCVSHGAGQVLREMNRAAGAERKRKPQNQN